MSCRDLMVWRESILLLERVHALAEQLPEKGSRALAERLMRHAEAVPGRIARGEGSGDRREFLRCLHGADDALSALHSLLVLAEQLGHLDARDLDALERSVEAVAIPLRALMARVRRDVGILD